MKLFIIKLCKLFFGFLILIFVLVIYDRFFSEKLPFISDENIEQIRKSDIVFVGSSHTQFHIIPDTVEKHTGKKVSILASGGAYLIDNLYLINVLSEEGILDGKTVYAQFELSGSFENHSRKSYYALNLPIYVYKEILFRSSMNELKEFFTSMMIDIFYVEDFEKRPSGEFRFTKCEAVRQKRTFPVEKFEKLLVQRNGVELGCSYSNTIITLFNKNMLKQKKFKYINYIALGSNNGNYSKSNLLDLRLNRDFIDSNLWWDSNHLNFKGACLYSKLISSKLIK